MNKFLLGLLLASIVIGCRAHDHGSGGHQHGPSGEHVTPSATPAGETEEAIARTEFNDRLVNFFEFDPLKPGRVSHFLIHLTDLSTGQPVSQANVTLTVRSGGSEVKSVKAKVGKVTGIYVAELELSEPGTYGLEFQIKNDILDETMKLEGFEVSTQPSQPAPEPEAPSGPTVAFLMEQQWLIDMKLATAEKRAFARPIAATGRIVPAANSHAVVSSPVPGKLTGQYMPRIGQQVYSDQPLAVVTEVPRASEEAQVRAAMAQVRAAQTQTAAQLKSQNALLKSQNAQALVENARLEAEKEQLAGQVAESAARLEHARHEARRAREVYKIDAISQKELSAVEEELLTVTAEHTAALSRQKALAKALPLPQAPLLSESVEGLDSGRSGASLTLVAPLSGVVTKVHKSLGEQVQSGEAICEVTQIDPVWLEAPVFEANLGELSQGMEATFSVISYPKEEFRGTLIDLGSVIDEKTRAATVLFQVPNGKRLLRLGMQANVRLASQNTVEATVIPKDAVLDRDGKTIVYVLLGGEEFVRRDVTVAEDLGSMVSLTSGVSAGERVVSQGAYQLFLQETEPAGAVPHSHET
jgi:multidrug efflux pump subunit AcrA (membrane-fusion protein)